MRKSVLLIIATTIMLVSSSVFSVDNDELNEILKGFDSAQKDANSIAADFVQVKTLSLLEEPTESKGKFYYSKPDKFLWEYTVPSEAYLLMNGDSLTSYYPEFKTADVINIKRYRKRIMKYLGIGQSVEVLNDVFDIELVTENRMKGTYLLKLDPTKKRVEKKLKLIRMWIDMKSYLPVQLEYIEGDGDITVFRFSSIEINSELRDGIFKLVIPGDVKINHSTDNLFPG